MPASGFTPYEKSGVVNRPPYFDPSDYFSCYVYVESICEPKNSYTYYH